MAAIRYELAPLSDGLGLNKATGATQAIRIKIRPLATSVVICPPMPNMSTISTGVN
jgi:hypothetical protein